MDQCSLPNLDGYLSPYSWFLTYSLAGNVVAGNVSEPVASTPRNCWRQCRQGWRDSILTVLGPQSSGVPVFANHQGGKLVGCWFEFLVAVQADQPV